MQTPKTNHSFGEQEQGILGFEVWGTTFLDGYSIFGVAEWKEDQAGIWRA